MSARVPCPFSFSSFPSYSYSTYGVKMRPKPCHVRRIGHPCHPKTTVVRCACSSVDLQTTRGGPSNPQALGVQVARSLSMFYCCSRPGGASNNPAPRAHLVPHHLSWDFPMQPAMRASGTAPGPLDGIGDFALGLGPREMSGPGRCCLYSFFVYYSILGGALAVLSSCQGCVARRCDTRRNLSSCAPRCD